MHPIDSGEPEGWPVAVNQISYGVHMIKESTASYAKIETASSHIYIPQSDFQSFAERLHSADARIGCRDGHCVAEKASCSNLASALSPLSFHFGNSTAYRLPPKAYLGERSLGGCDILVRSFSTRTSDSSSSIVLGTPFIK